jgi:uncharacterized OB-fold protein
MSTPILDDELVTRFRQYGVDQDSAAHFRGRLERRLLINRCGACGRWHHRPKPVCPDCWSSDVSPTEVGGTGTIFLLVLLHQGPPAEGVDYATPYPVVTVELDEQPGLRFTSALVGSPNEDIAIGKRVTLDWLDRGDVTLPVFRLAEVTA